MGLIDTFPAARVIVLMLPPFLRKPKLIQWLRILFVPLSYVHDQFKTYIVAQRKVLAWRMTRGGLALRLNTDYYDNDGGIHVVTERIVRQLYILSLDSEGGYSFLTGLDSESAIVKPACWLDSEVGDDASLIVSLSSPFGSLYAGYVPEIRKLIETYLPAGVKYQIIIQS